MLNGSLFSSSKDDWETPQDFFDELNKEFDFNLDAAATKENAKCRYYFTKERNALEYPWDVIRNLGSGSFCEKGRVWLNPPYGRDIGKWVEKAARETLIRYGHCNAEVVVMLLPARTDTRWFHNYIYNQAEIRFIKGRLKFSNSPNSAPFPSMLVIFKGVKAEV